MKAVYLDNHSNTKVDVRVYAEMLPYLKEFYGNAQSMHFLGGRSMEAVDKARRQVADLIGSREDEIYFTSCASEANNLAVKGAAQAHKNRGKHIVVSGIEHFSVLHSARRLGASGFDVTYLPVDRYGLVSPDEVRKAVRSDTVLVSVQHGNPEIGTLQPIEELAKAAHEKGALFHTDAVATACTMPLNAGELGVDLLTLSSSRIYGPKGAAALYIRKGVRVIPQIDGGIQEGGMRAGTENVPAIVGFGKACEIAKSEMESNLGKVIRLRDRLISELPAKIEHLHLNGHPEKRLPDNVSFLVEFVEGESMFLFLDQKGIYVTSGSSCASKSLKMSHVLSAIKVDPALGQGSVMMTLSKYSTDGDVDYVLAELPPIVKRLREISPLYDYFLKTGRRRSAGPGTDYAHAQLIS